MTSFLFEYSKIFIMGSVFLAVYSSVVSLHILTTRQRNAVLERMSKFTNSQQEHRGVREVELSAPFFQRVIHPQLAKLSGRTKKLLPAEKAAALQQRLILAGNPGNLSPGEFIALQYVIAIIFAVATVLTTISIGVEPYRMSLLGAAALILGYIIPVIYLNSLISSRKQSIQRDLPDVLDLLKISVEAGLGFDGALVKVIEKTDGVLASEFKRVLQEVKKGKARRVALKDMAERCQVDDLSTFVGAVVQADQLGVSIGNVLKIQADQMRQKRRQRAEETAMKAPVKMLIPLIFFIFPTIFIVLLGPAVIQIIETFAN